MGGGGYCAARSEVSKYTNVGRNEITVPGGAVVSHRRRPYRLATVPHNWHSRL